MKIVFPHFIASKYELIISSVKVNGRYYVHDNGTVINYLKETGKYNLFEKNRGVLEKVFGFVVFDDKIQRSYTLERQGLYDFIVELQLM